MQELLLSAPALNVTNGRPTTLSTQVASFFGKLHKNVIRDIKNLIDSVPELGRLNFELSSYINEQGKEQPCFVMDRKGFVLLAMGFTGEQALKFKIAYIDAFDAMEEQLRNSTVRDNRTVATLTPAQQLLIQQAVGRRAQKTASHYQTIYRAIKLRFQIAKYDQLPQSQLNECLKFINEVDLRVPEAPKCEPEKALPTKPRVTYTVTADFLEKQRTFVYCIRYLFRDPLMQAMKVMQALDVPNANRLWDVVHDFNLAELESNLDRLGYPVKELDCYKHLMKLTQH